MLDMAVRVGWFAPYCFCCSSASHNAKNWCNVLTSRSNMLMEAPAHIGSQFELVFIVMYELYHHETLCCNLLVKSVQISLPLPF
jgi:hypothetical protein